jgi:hypothetical protein
VDVVADSLLLYTPNFRSHTEEQSLSDGDPPSTVSTSLGEPEVAVEGIVHSSVASASPSRETSDSEADDESMTVTNSDFAGSKTGGSVLLTYLNSISI